ncbi:hypothetical protein HMPREF9412_2044 [Paenibacillus sp. HGF5]|nr:hypothetical protein HMPREF9412_2044 [Paenibacillus sp. HGF5]
MKSGAKKKSMHPKYTRKREKHFNYFTGGLFLSLDVMIRFEPCIRIFKKI